MFCVIYTLTDFNIQQMKHNNGFTFHAADKTHSCLSSCINCSAIILLSPLLRFVWLLMSKCLNSFGQSYTNHFSFTKGFYRIRWVYFFNALSRFLYKFPGDVQRVSEISVFIPCYLYWSQRCHTPPKLHFPQFLAKDIKDIRKCPALLITGLWMLHSWIPVDKIHISNNWIKSLNPFLSSCVLFSR